MPMHFALADLKPEHLWGIDPGSLRYPLAGNITALPLREIPGLELGHG
jgi:hypothetical protein